MKLDDIFCVDQYIIWIASLNKQKNDMAINSACDVLMTAIFSGDISDRDSFNEEFFSLDLSSDIIRDTVRDDIRSWYLGDNDEDHEIILIYNKELELLVAWDRFDIDEGISIYHKQTTEIFSGRRGKGWTIRELPI